MSTHHKSQRLHNSSGIFSIYKFHVACVFGYQNKVSIITWLSWISTHTVFSRIPIMQSQLHRVNWTFWRECAEVHRSRQTNAQSLPTQYIRMRIDFQIQVTVPVLHYFKKIMETIYDQYGTLLCFGLIVQHNCNSGLLKKNTHSVYLVVGAKGAFASVCNVQETVLVFMLFV